MSQLSKQFTDYAEKLDVLNFLNGRKLKPLLPCGSFLIPSVVRQSAFKELSTQINDLHTNCDILLLGDFNVTHEDFKVRDFKDA